jgi:hypothetical protein
MAVKPVLQILPSLLQGPVFFTLFNNIGHPGQQYFYPAQAYVINCINKFLRLQFFVTRE